MPYINEKKRQIEPRLSEVLSGEDQRVEWDEECSMANEMAQCHHSRHVASDGHRCDENDSKDGDDPGSCLKLHRQVKEGQRMPTST